MSWLLRIKFWGVANHGDYLGALADGCTRGSCKLFLCLLGCWGLDERIIGADGLILFSDWSLNGASLTQSSINGDVNLGRQGCLDHRHLLNFLMMQKFGVCLIRGMP